MYSPHYYENSTSKKGIRAKLLKRFEAMVIRNPNTKVFSVFLLPGEQWAFEQELCTIAVKYPDRVFLICCFEENTRVFETSAAPMGNTHLPIRYTNQVSSNVHLVYVNAKFATSNATLMQYFSHIPAELTAALQSPRFIWADFCGWPNAQDITTLSNNTRKGDLIFSTFALNFSRAKHKHEEGYRGITEALWPLIRFSGKDTESNAKVCGDYILSLIRSSAYPRGCTAKRIEDIRYRGDQGERHTMMLSGFEVCSRV